MEIHQMPCLSETALVLYTRDAGSRGFSKTTVTNTCLCIRRFCGFLGKEDLATISGEDLKGFIVALREQKVWDDSPRARDRQLSATSINTYVRAIRAFWGWLAAQKLIETNSMAEIPAPKTPRTVPKVFSQEEMSRIIEAVNNDPLEKVIIFIFIEAGVRLGGLAALNLSDVDPEQGQIRVKGKGAKDYTGYITEPTIDALKAYLEVRQKTGYQGDKLLVSPEGKPILAGSSRGWRRSASGPGSASGYRPTSSGTLMPPCRSNTA
jgi:integrase/recombinase XerD